MLFIMLTRLIGKSIHPETVSLQKLEQDVEKNITQFCPQVKWVSNYAVFGPYDYLDVFFAPDIESAMKVAAIVRSSGHASTEIWPAIEWEDFKKLIPSLPQEKNFSQK